MIVLSRIKNDIKINLKSSAKSRYSKAFCGIMWNEFFKQGKFLMHFDAKRKGHRIWHILTKTQCMEQMKKNAPSIFALIGISSFTLIVISMLAGLW
jgi:hypothetical protein